MQKQTAQDNKGSRHVVDNYEVYCGVCGSAHNNPAYEEGHPCRHKKHKLTPCTGLIQMQKPNLGDDGQAEEEEDEDDEGGDE